MNSGFVGGCDTVEVFVSRVPFLSRVISLQFSVVSVLFSVISLSPSLLSSFIGLPERYLGFLEGDFESNNTGFSVR